MFGLGKPNAEAAAVRALILKVVAMKAFQAPLRPGLPALLSAMPAAERAAFEAKADKDRRAALAELGPLCDLLSPIERAYFKSDAITMSERQQIDGSYRIQAFGVLAWALGEVAVLPPYDVGVDDGLVEAVPGEVYYDEFIRKARLRPRRDIDHARDLAELWHWRSRTRELHERNHPVPETLRARGLKSFDDIARMAAKEAHARGDIDLVEDDFAAFGKPYRALTEDEWSRVRSITMERHFTLNWLCGYAPGNRWDETPTET